MAGLLKGYRMKTLSLGIDCNNFSYDQKIAPRVTEFDGYYCIEREGVLWQNDGSREECIVSLISHTRAGVWNKIANYRNGDTELLGGGPLRQEGVPMTFKQLEKEDLEKVLR